MRGAIEFTQKTLGGAVKEVPPQPSFRFQLRAEGRAVERDPKAGD